MSGRYVTIKGDKSLETLTKPLIDSEHKMVVRIAQTTSECPDGPAYLHKLPEHSQLAHFVKGDR